MTTTPLHTHQRTQQNEQTSIISEKISALNLTHIESIARTLIGHILPNLGHVGCANVMEKFLEKIEIIFDEGQLEQFHCRRLAAEHAKLIGKSDFCTPLHERLFTEQMVPLFMVSLKQSFLLNSRNFVDNGLTLKLSDSSSEGFIYTQGKQLEAAINDPSDFEITTFHIPPLYLMSLRIDRIFNKESSTLFQFTLAESAEGVWFSNKSFTIINQE